MKRALIWIIITLLLFGGGYFYYVNYYTGPYSPPRDPDDGITLFPDFDTATTTLPQAGTTTPAEEVDEDEQTEDTSVPVYQQITADPVAGAGSLRQTVTVPQGTSTVATSTNTLIQYQKQSNGHIFRTNPQTQSTVRISNTTLTGVQRTLFNDTGEYFIAQYMDNSGTILRTITGSVSDQSSRRRLPQNVEDIAFAPNSNNIFYIQPAEDGAAGVITNPADTNRTVVFRSRLQEWLTHWHTSNQITLTTKPANGITGFSSYLNTSNGSTERQITDTPGLTTLTSPNGQQVLYLQSSGDQNTLYVYDTQTNTRQRLSVSTLPEKCVWADTTSVYCGVPDNISQGSIPESWYQGRTTFRDRIVEIDIPSGIVTTLLQPSQLDRPPVDAIKLGLSPDGRYLHFVNKKDGSLWSLDLFRARGEGFGG
jgi:hypothetical protein